MCLCVCKRDGVEERKRNGSSSGTLSTFERFDTGERIFEAVKWGCVNMPVVEEQDVGQLASQFPKIKRPNKCCSKESIDTSVCVRICV